MSRMCELTGKAVLSGNNVSHANNKTKRKFLPNLVKVTLISEALNQNVRLRVSANALRSVEHRSGLDAFLAKADASELSQRAKLLKKQIANKLAEQAACSRFAGGFPLAGSVRRLTGARTRSDLLFGRNSGRKTGFHFSLELLQLVPSPRIKKCSA